MTTHKTQQAIRIMRRRWLTTLDAINACGAVVTVAAHQRTEAALLEIPPAHRDHAQRIAGGCVQVGE